MTLAINNNLYFLLFMWIGVFATLSLTLWGNMIFLPKSIHKITKRSWGLGPATMRIYLTFSRKEKNIKSLNYRRRKKNWEENILGCNFVWESFKLDTRYSQIFSNIGKKANTGYFREVYRSLLVRVPRNILNYLSIQNLPQMRSHQSIYLSNSHKKNILCFNFINKM